MGCTRFRVEPHIPIAPGGSGDRRPPLRKGLVNGPDACGETKASDMSVGAKLVTVDNRQRVSLAKLADREHYLVSKEIGGRSVLTPAVVAPEVVDYPDELRDNIPGA